MHRNIFRLSTTLLTIYFFLFSDSSKAEDGWIGYTWRTPPQPDIISACRAVAEIVYSPPSWPHPQEDVKKETIRITNIRYQFVNPVMAYCSIQLRSPFFPYDFYPRQITVYRYGVQCVAGKSFNPGTGACDAMTGEIDRKQLGIPPFQSCDSNTFTGNPINYATGNKIQVEHDYTASSGSPLTLERHYNSKEGIWRHSYSQRLFITSDKVVMRQNDGRQIHFTRSGDVTTPESTELGHLTLLENGNWFESTWTYTSSNNEKLVFDYQGKLISKNNSLGQKVMISYSGDAVTLTDEYRKYLILKEYGLGQPLSVENQDVKITYSYNDHGQLSSVSIKYQGDETTEHRTYLYEVSTNSNLLTGIVDERGVRFATWNYDEQGRAISSEHANEAYKKTITYNIDGSTSVTNELGRTTTYKFETIQGVKRVTSIIGQPSSSCPLSNSIFAYNDRGQISERTDALGNVTVFHYNNIGLEVSRTEASGTPLARTTITEWDSSRHLKTKVIEPNQIKLYTYDDNGRLSSKRVTSN